MMGGQDLERGPADVTSECVTLSGDEAKGDVIRRCPTECQAVGGGEKRRHRSGIAMVISALGYEAAPGLSAGRMPAGRSLGRWSRLPGRRRRMQAHAA